MNEQQLRQLSDEAGDAAEHLIAAAQRWQIDTPLRQAHWLAQLGHESRGFERTVENLNYRAEALMKTFGSRFPDLPTALKYAHKPREIANKAYSNRIGNGDEKSGDGWRYRGRGYLQNTGKDGYRAVSQGLFGDERLLDEPELLEEPQCAASAAGWFWKANNLNKWADADDVKAVSSLVNRGSLAKVAHGMADRELWLAKAKRVLGVVA